MKVSEYIRRKNAIIEKATGLTLVPEDQIIDVEPMILSMGDDGCACPYCCTYFSCSPCVMTMAGNYCEANHSTYTSVIKALKGRITCSPIRDEIQELINEYNKSNGF